ncbi:glycoside hydrolase family 92 protein [Cadophora sp. DSE1049]|nr:glycoside hydrolase family 92 protein [Cadophora sp. DSE1049]
MYRLVLNALIAVGAAQSQSQDLSQYVLPSTGSINGGNTFDGVALPFGMVKLGADVFSGIDNYSGNSPYGNFTGFSMMHESGTGDAPKYGVVSQLPVLGDITNPLANLHATRSAADITSLGYFKASLGSNITVELSATSRAGIYHYTFPTGSKPNIVVDVSHVLPSFRGQGLSQTYRGGNITTLDDHYEGYGIYDNGWNRAPDWKIYFCGYFDQPTTARTFVARAGDETIIADYSNDPRAVSTTRVGSVFTFSTTSVTSRVGISFISSAQACDNVNSQIPDGTTLETVRDNVRKVWNADVLSKIRTTETNVGNLQLLYSSMYHMHLIPSNRTGENPLWSSDEPYFDDTFTLWDLFRCTISLWHVLQPEFLEQYLRSFIDIFRFEGYTGGARSSNYNGAVQGGTSVDNILTDAYVKGLRGAINWTTGYEAMVQNAEVVPPLNNGPRDMSSSTKVGRGPLPDWLEYGFITKFGRSVSRAVEYAVNDFSLAQVAAGFGKQEDLDRYLARSRQWQNHWNSDATSLNFTGFLVPRTTNSFIEQDPLTCGGCYWADAYYQALPWEYSANAHHDISSLTTLCGGPETFLARLELIFKPGINTSGRSVAFNNTIFNPGNEPSFATPVKHSRFIVKSYYSPTPGGLLGNSDAGAMESWLIWNMLGLYPMVGQATSSSGLRDKALTVTTFNGSDSSFYVQSLRVNGDEWSKSWVTWDDVFVNGGTMDFVLGPEPRNWTTGPHPPSPASELGKANIPTSIPTRPLWRNVGLGVMGAVLFLLGVAAVVFWWTRKRKRRVEAVTLTKESESDGSRVTVDS